MASSSCFSKKKKPNKQKKTNKQKQNKTKKNNELEIPNRDLWIDLCGQVKIEAYAVYLSTQRRGTSPAFARKKNPNAG